MYIDVNSMQIRKHSCHNFDKSQRNSHKKGGKNEKGSMSAARLCG